MTTTVNLRKMLHRKSAEYCAPNPAGNTAAGAFIVSDKSNIIQSHDIAYYVGGASAIWNYNSDQDAWIQLPNSGAAGTFAAGACGEFRAVSAPAGVIDLTPGIRSLQVHYQPETLSLARDRKSTRLNSSH